MATIAPWLVRGLLLAALIYGGHQIIGQVVSWLDMSLLPHTEDMLHRAIIAGTAVYVLLMAIPFVPGAEIGLTLLAVFGGAIAPLIYLATATSLMLAYLIGRLLPPTLLQRGMSSLGLVRAAEFVEEAARMSPEDFQDGLASTSGPKFLKPMLRYRYVALALAVNMPGNIVLGGGGGIAMMAGLSRLFDPLPFLLTILIAVLPIPLMFYIGRL